MTLELHLPAELEAELRRQAEQRGEDVQSFVLGAVQDRLAGKSEMQTDRVLEGDAWEQEFAAWLASHKPTGRFVDDSRESIYDGRGE
jgi:hypothetical protein